MRNDDPQLKTVEVKPWYRSKTLWFNVLVILIAAAEYFLGRPFTNGNPAVKEAFMAVAAIGNLVLRLVTGQPVSRS